MDCTIYTPLKFYEGDEIKEREMNGGMQHARGKMLCRVSVGGRSAGRRGLRRPMRRWEDNIKWVLNKDDGTAWIGFIWLDRDKRRNFVHTVMNFRLP